jgi:hypothetical protein
VIGDHVKQDLWTTDQNKSDGQTIFKHPLFLVL